MDAITVKNVKLKWAFLAEPNTKGEYASNKYQVDILVPSATAKEITAKISKRQKFKKDEETGLYSLSVKSSKKPMVMDAHKHLMSDDDIRKIGNGSEGHVKINFFEVRKEVFAGLNAVMVTKLVEYVTDPFEDVEVEDEDVAEDSAKSDEAPFDDDIDDII